MFDLWINVKINTVIRRIFMNDYKELYFYLFNRITDMNETLMEIQKKCEEMYIDSEIERDLDETERISLSVQK